MPKQIFPQRILIIDESEPYTYMVTNRLANYGYEEVYTASNGTDGLAKVELLRPDVVAIDVGLSDVDSFQLCQTIKASFNGLIKVVMMVGLAKQYNEAQAKSFGADEYVVKTFDSLPLIAAIKRALYINYEIIHIRT